ncbi:MAG: hypothetical protein AAGJ35_09470, partial [Myxococcota bacterium]
MEHSLIAQHYFFPHDAILPQTHWVNHGLVVQSRSNVLESLLLKVQNKGVNDHVKSYLDHGSYRWNWQTRSQDVV